jgi:cytochrome c oxidase subunit III
MSTLPLPTSDRNHQVPARANTIGMALFLISLGMLFASSIVGYVIIRITSRNAPEINTLQIPSLMWVSTVLILLSSFTIHRALVSIRRERKTQLTGWLLVTAGLSLAFVLVQFPALMELLNQHRTVQVSGMHLYGLIFFLILVHALHVIGGLAALTTVTIKALRHAYDHETHAGVRFTSMYWHFLDIVWIIMFGVFLLVA